MDDIIVGSNGMENHMRDLHSLFQRLKEKGLLLNKNKCQLGRPSLTFLGHLDAEGAGALPRYMCLFPPFHEACIREDDSTGEAQGHFASNVV